MTKIFVPQEALESPETFMDWYQRMSLQIFAGTNANSRQKIFTEDDTYALKIVEQVMKYANLIYNNDFSVIPYREKNKKLACGYSDIMSVTISIIMNNYVTSLVRLGHIIGLNHSTVIHHIKKHKGNLLYLDYKSKYCELLIMLQNEGYIPTIKTMEPKSKRVLLDALLG